MEISEYVLSSSFLVIISMLIMLFFSDYNWIISIFMVAFIMIIRLTQVDDFKPKLDFSRNVSGRAFQEVERIHVVLNIHNPTNYIFRGEIADELPESSYLWKGSNVTLIQLKPEQTTEINYVFSFPRRGKYSIGPIHIRYHSYGETFEETWVVKKYHNFVIIPNPEKVNSYSLPPSFLTAFGGPFRSKLVGDGIDFTGIREYFPSDPFKRVNWKQTAKLKKLHSNEFEINRATDVIIILDLTEESTEIADSSVRAALGLIDYLTHARCRVGLISIGEYIHFIPPKIGKRHLLEISEHLTNVKSINKIKNFDLFKQRFIETISRARSSKNEILLFSSLNRWENAVFFAKWLPELGRVSILSPSGTIIPKQSNELLEFAQQLLELRKQIIANFFQRMDIKIYEWIPELPFQLSISNWRKR